MLTDDELAAVEAALTWDDCSTTRQEAAQYEKHAATLRALADRGRNGGWQPIKSAPKDERFLAAIEVLHVSGKTWWEQHVIWLDDETGDIHPEADQGWSLCDYYGWQPLPEPPSRQP